MGGRWPSWALDHGWSHRSQPGHQRLGGSMTPPHPIQEQNCSLAPSPFSYPPGQGIPYNMIQECITWGLNEPSGGAWVTVILAQNLPLSKSPT